MRSECLPVASIPQVSALYRDYLCDYSRVAPFYAASPTNPNYGELVSKVKYPAERRVSVADVLERQNRDWGASAKTLENINRLRKGAAAVVTGQQVVLFGGPMFSILKALTAIKHAEEAKKAGVDCVPIFWLASEDHDLEEVSSATMFDQSGALLDLRLPFRGNHGRPVGQLEFGEEMQSLCEEAAASCSDHEVAELLRRCYKPRGQTFASAFARLFAKIFSEFGLILIDPADTDLHTIAKPLLKKAVQESVRLTEGLFARTKELESEGYHAQVKVTNSSTVLFALQNGVRTVVHRANGHFTVGKEKLEEKELLSRIEARPQDFSGNALFRPAIQDFLLPTLAYVGGPAEVAYFAQSQVVYKKLLERVTAVLPRISATIIDTKVQRLIKKYGLRVPDAFMASGALRKRIATRVLPAALSEEFGRSQELIQERFAVLSQQLRALDPTIEDAAKRSLAKMQYQLERLKGRAASAEERKNADLARHSKAISDALFPHEDLQERRVAGVSLLGRNGLSLLHQLNETLDLHCLGHQLLYL
jgi:bacillithiol biosynthesis cysteine-adding enzyme BshC